MSHMNRKALAGHTIDLDLLSEFPAILDVGCRGFDFSSGIVFWRPQSLIVALEPDPAVKPIGWELHERFTFLRYALVGDEREKARYARYSTGEGNFLTDLPEYYGAEFIEVPCMNIAWLMRILHIAHFDVVKLDCEGSEFGILENWPGPIASQISVEFHDSGYTPGYGPDYDYGPMFRRLKGFGYKIVQHELSKQGDGTGHWDSLLVL
jgi:FkbM family methyltransferase